MKSLAQDYKQEAELRSDSNAWAFLFEKERKIALSRVWLLQPYGL